MRLQKILWEGRWTGCSSGVRPARSLRAFRAFAQAKEQQPFRLSLAINGPRLPSNSSLPLSFRSITTDPNFFPATEGCHQYAPGAPQLLSRHLTANPLHGLVAWVEAQVSGIDRGFAAAMDGAPLAHVAAAAVTGLFTYLGLHPISLLRGGLPVVWADWLEAQAGGWAVSVVALAALVVGLAAALWQLRTWVAAQLAMIRFDDVLKGATETRAASAAAVTEAGAVPEEAGAAAAAATGSEAAAAGPFQRLIPPALHGLFESDWKATDKTWLYVLIAARLGILFTAATSLLRAGTAQQAAIYAGLCFACSLLPAALPHVRHLLAPQAVRLAAPLLLADAGFLLTLAPAAPLPARAAAAVALALGSGLAAVTAAASPRLASVRAAAGDVATFNVTVRLPLNGTLIDSTVGHRPLRAVVGTQAEFGAADAQGTEGQGEVSAISLTGPALADPRVVGSTEGVVIDPQARFRPLQALAAASVVQGMYIGERRTMLVDVDTEADGDDDSDSAVPYKNPGLVWWQSMDDLRRKIGGSVLDTRPLHEGDVFWYPVGSLVSELGATRLSTRAEAASASAAAVAALPGADSWGPVQVVAMAGEWLQLDANFGLGSGQAEVEVELVELAKAGQA